MATLFVPLALTIGFLGQFESNLFAGVPKRIVSLSLASDEILLDLLAKCGSTNQIAGLSVFADDPGSSSVVEAAKSVKGRVHSEPESLFILKPDLVIAASFNRPELLKMIRAKKIKILTLENFANSNDISDHILAIGDLIGCPRDAQELNEKFKQRLANSTNVPPKKISLISYSADMTIMGKDTLFDELVIRSGATNAASEMGLRHWPRIDTETLLKLKPDKIVILGDDTLITRQSIKSHPAWGRLEAVKNEDFIFLEAKTALSTSHYFAGAVEELRKKLSPKG